MTEPSIASDESLIAALEQLRHADRVATLGRLASSVAHELGNPLNVIELRAQLITNDVETLEEARQNAAIIVDQSQRMTRILSEILSFARVQPAKIARIDLASVLRKAIALSEHTAKKHGNTIVFDAPSEPIELDGDAEKLLQVIVNLVVNGVHSMPDGGALRLRTSSERRAAIDDPDGPHREYVCIEIADQGCGIPEQTIAKVFDAFFSTKIADGGTGLGLSVAQGIAHEHEGWIAVTSEVGKGSSFKVYLPKLGLRDGHAESR